MVPELAVVDACAELRYLRNQKFAGSLKLAER